MLLGIGTDKRLERLKEAIGVAQHHDAITGTAKQPVSDDYSERLHQGTTESFDMFSEAYRLVDSFTYTVLSFSLYCTTP